MNDPLKQLHILKAGSANVVAVGVVLESVCERYELKVADLVSPSRRQPLTLARHVAMYLIRELTELTFPMIGDYFNRDHSTVIHAHRAITKTMRTPEFAAEIRRLRAMIETTIEQRKSE